MKRLSALGILMLCCIGWIMAQIEQSGTSHLVADSISNNAHTELTSLGHIDSTSIDSISKLSSDTMLVAINDSVDTLFSDSIQTDSLGVDSLLIDTSDVSRLSGISLSLSPESEVVDSTALIMEKVKEVTDRISSQSILNATLVNEVFSDTAIVNKYNRLLKRMVKKHEHSLANVNIDYDSVIVNPLYFRLFAPMILYKDPVGQALGLKSEAELAIEDNLRLSDMLSGKDVRLATELNNVLLAVYMSDPTLVQMTEDSLMQSKSLSEEVIKNTSENVKLNVPTTISSSLNDASKAELLIDMAVSKPNFWRTKGTFSAQMTESFFSPNWYQGGTNNINMLSTMTLEANYNNKRKVQWNNKVEARIGFYQNEDADIQSNQDLLRVTSKLNLKAVYNWNYTIEAQGNTQMMQHFNNDNTLKSRFMTPADASLTIGMDFKKNFKKGSLSIFPGPLSYKVNYVANKDLAQRYGIDEGKSARHDIGSKLQIDFDYKITNNIRYKTRFYYYTGRYEYVQMDWENTFDFQVSKYISATLFFHTRFDDKIKPHEDWKYLQFKEYLTFGLNYSW